MRLCMTPVIPTEPLCIAGCFSTRNVTDDEFPAFPSKKTQPLCVPMIPVMKPFYAVLPLDFSGITFVFALPQIREVIFGVNGVALIKKGYISKIFHFKAF